jgi:uncharacterized protein
MIAVDTSVLVYAHRADADLHKKALKRLRGLAEGQARWAIPVSALSEFARLITHKRLFDTPHSVEEAILAMDRLLESPSLAVIHPGDRFPKLFAEALRQGNAAGNLVANAHVVAVCREAGVSALLTEDRDFDRFPRFATVRL